jgi:LacI family transcriptional regulator
MPEQPRRITAADVAARAGCSTAAVSLWLNGKSEGRLTEAWQARIAKAVAELGYVPNRAARSLSLGESRALVFLFPGARFSFFGEVVDGVTNALGADWEMHFVDSRRRPGAAIASPIDRALAMSPAALIIVGPSPKDLADLAAVTVPTVAIDVNGLPDRVSAVEIDFDQALLDLSADLLVGDISRVAYVGYDVPSVSVMGRRPTIASALETAGITMLDPEFDLTLGSVDVAAAALAFEENWPRWQAAGVQGVVCGDERHAYGVVTAARAMGLTIPTDFGLVSFHDLDPAAILSPSLSSIRVPGRELGSSAGRLMLDYLATGKPSKHTIVAEYVARDSTPGPRG